MLYASNSYTKVFSVPVCRRQVTVGGQALTCLGNGTSPIVHTVQSHCYRSSQWCCQVTLFSHSLDRGKATPPTGQSTARVVAPAMGILNIFNAKSCVLLQLFMPNLATKSAKNSVPYPILVPDQPV